METKIIDGFENYAVSSDGYVFNVITGLKLKPSIKKSGYAEVHLVNKEHRVRCFLLHRLVAEAFCKKGDDAEEVNHIDGNKTNNNYLNLEWTTHNNNLKHAYKNGLRNQDVSAKRVVATDMITGCKTIYSSIYKAAKALGISQGNICMCCQGKRPYANGFYWNYE